MTFDTVTVQGRLDELAREHHIPGAVLAITDGEHVIEVATGILNVESGVSATPDSVFHIASMTKMYTATLVMQLVDEGMIDLDVPMRRYLPELRLPDDEATEMVTTRHLLSHTAGFDGDNIGQYGEGPDAIGRYVADIHTLPQMGRPGEVYSYSNGGFALLGHLVEKVRGVAWYEALRTSVLDRLDVATPLTALADVLYRRTAVGHVPGPEDSSVVFRGTPTRAGAPGGDWWSYATARDVLALVSAHLHDGRRESGATLLSTEAIAQMRTPQVSVPDRTETDAWGLGLALWSSNGHTVVGHGGNLLCMTSFARWLPELGAGMVLLTNSAMGELLFRSVFEEIFGAAWGLKTPAALAIPETPPPGIDFNQYVGVYERRYLRITIECGDGGLVMTVDASGPMAGAVPPIPLPLSTISREAFVVNIPGFPVTIPVHFTGFDAGGTPGFMFVQNRISRKVA